jgi:hypothetical protein
MAKESQAVIFAGSSHVTPWDAHGESVLLMRHFLNAVDFLNRR